MATIYEIAWTEYAKENHLDEEVGCAVEQDTILRACEDIINQLEVGSYVVSIDTKCDASDEFRAVYTVCSISRNYAVADSDDNWTVEAKLLAEVKAQ